MERWRGAQNPTALNALKEVFADGVQLSSSPANAMKQELNIPRAIKECRTNSACAWCGAQQGGFKLRPQRSRAPSPAE